MTERKKSRMTILDREIKEIKEKLSPQKSTSEYITMSTNLKNHLKKEEREQKIKKQKKYARDVNDYKTNCVYSWQRKDTIEENMDHTHVQMDVSQPPISESKTLSIPQQGPPPRPPIRLTINGSNMTVPDTPKFQQRGPLPMNKGRGRGSL